MSRRLGFGVVIPCLPRHAVPNPALPCHACLVQQLLLHSQHSFMNELCSLSLCFPPTCDHEQRVNNAPIGDFEGMLPLAMCPHRRLPRDLLAGLLRLRPDREPPRTPAALHGLAGALLPACAPRVPGSVQAAFGGHRAHPAALRALPAADAIRRAAIPGTGRRRLALHAQPLAERRASLAARTISELPPLSRHRSTPFLPFHVSTPWLWRRHALPVLPRLALPCRTQPRHACHATARHRGVLQVQAKYETFLTPAGPQVSLQAARLLGSGGGVQPSSALPHAVSRSSSQARCLMA
jgi:hypothetical protein